jgi:hypothetical protein
VVVRVWEVLVVIMLGWVVRWGWGCGVGSE